MSNVNCPGCTEGGPHTEECTYHPKQKLVSVDEAAEVCDRLAQMMELGAGEDCPGHRLRQAARLIRELGETNQLGKAQKGTTMTVAELIECLQNAPKNDRVLIEMIPGSGCAQQIAEPVLIHTGREDRFVLLRPGSVVESF